MLAYDTDPDGDNLTVLNVGSPSSAGGTVALSGDYIFYMPPSGSANTDTFAYTVSDGNCGGIAVGVGDGAAQGGQRPRLERHAGESER